jgi:hypothetical protein
MNRIRKTREILDNHFGVIRDAVQYKRPFVIVNFVTKEQMNRFLNDLDLYGRLPYIIQEIRSHKSNFPSIFITNHGSTVSLPEFQALVKHMIGQYKLDSIVCLYNGGVSVFYKNGEHSPIGEEIYGSTDPTIFTSDYYKVGSHCYTFL